MQIAGSVYLLPENNVPSSHDGAPKRPWISARIEENFGHFSGTEEGKELHLKENALFSIRRANTFGMNSKPLGDGVFVAGSTPNKVVYRNGDLLPIFFWGRIRDFESYMSTQGNRGQPGFPGMFALKAPYFGLVLLIDERCPGAKINDFRKTGNTFNIFVQQNSNPRSLFRTHVAAGRHQFLQVTAASDIHEGDQLLMDYGSKFWVEDKQLANSSMYEFESAESVMGVTQSCEIEEKEYEQTQVWELLKSPKTPVKTTPAKRKTPSATTSRQELQIR